MCGRFTREFTWREVHDFLDLRFPMLEPGQGVVTPSWNVAPTHQTPGLVMSAEGKAKLELMSWGLRPAWAARGEKGAPAPINARSETVASSGMFRGAFKSRRCLIPASGFYEWRNDGGTKQPFYIKLLNDPIFCFGAVWEPGVDGGPPTFATMTTRPNELMAKIHDRMPVIVRPERFGAWMNGEDATADFEPFPAEEMTSWPVGKRVGNPRNDDAGLITREADGGLFG